MVGRVMHRILVIAGVSLLAGPAQAQDQAPGAAGPASGDPRSTTAEASEVPRTRQRWPRPDHPDLVPETPDWARALLDNAEAWRSAAATALSEIKAEQGEPEPDPESRALSPDDPQRDELLARIDTAQEQLQRARDLLAGRPGGELADMLELLLATARARLSAEPLPTASDEDVARWLEAAQDRLDAARALSASSGPGSKDMQQQLDRAQEQLNDARRKSGTHGPAKGD